MVVALGNLFRSGRGSYCHRLQPRQHTADTRGLHHRRCRFLLEKDQVNSTPDNLNARAKWERPRSVSAEGPARHRTPVYNRPGHLDPEETNQHA